MNVTSLQVRMVALGLVATAVLVLRRTWRTAHRAEHSSRTAVEAAKLATVTATDHQQPADLERGRIRTFLVLDEMSIMSMYGKTRTPPGADPRGRARHVPRERAGPEVR